MTTQSTIHTATEIGTVTLKVSDLARSITFYTELIGLTVARQDAHSVALVVGDRPILRLEAVPGGTPQPSGTTGLYHVAILLPTRRALAIKVAQLAARRKRLGQADHLVSEAFYLSDPDGNGLELYRDRPRIEWHWDAASVTMASDPVDMDSLMAEIGNDSAALDHPALPQGTQVGHIHLRVGDIGRAESFYRGVLGFDVTARWPGALFVSAGGYHHHIGLNTWESRGGHAPPNNSAGLREFQIVLPDQAELDRMYTQIESNGVTVERAGTGLMVRDPWETVIRLVQPS